MGWGTRSQTGEKPWPVFDESGLIVARVEPFGGVIPDEVEKNALLIAAAPELLQCLIDVIPHLESVGPLAEFERARAVIEKATGHSAPRSGVGLNELLGGDPT